MTAPCWDLDWTIKSYLILSYSTFLPEHVHVHAQKYVYTECEQTNPHFFRSFQWRV
jgi:hypothetical protein